MHGSVGGAGAGDHVSRLRSPLRPGRDVAHDPGHRDQRGRQRRGHLHHVPRRVADYRARHARAPGRLHEIPLEAFQEFDVGLHRASSPTASARSRSRRSPSRRNARLTRARAASSEQASADATSG